MCVFIYCDIGASKLTLSQTQGHCISHPKSNADYSGDHFQYEDYGETCIVIGSLRLTKYPGRDFELADF